jgi:hypothetical protein
MRLAKDTRQTLGLAIEALIELLDAIGPDPEAEPSLGSIDGHHWSGRTRRLLPVTIGRVSTTAANPARTTSHPWLRLNR